MPLGRKFGGTGHRTSNRRSAFVSSCPSRRHRARVSTVGITIARSSVQPDAIEPKSILAEELLAIRQRHFRSSPLEAAVDVIPSAFEAIHGKIRGKHTSVHAKDPDCLANYRPIGCERPRLTQYRKAGDLAVDVIWQCRQCLHAPAPYFERLRRAVERVAG